MTTSQTPQVHPARRLLPADVPDGLQPVMERFYAKVRVNVETGCWEWTGHTNAKGYGQVRIAQRGHLAHRVSFAWHNGAIPDGAVVLHHCDNPPCVNPAHLKAGTQKENLHDAIRKGRRVQPLGERVGTAKLTAAQVLEIRRLIAAGDLSLRAIARRYGMNHTVIQAIAKGRRWAHVQEEV